MMFQCIFFEAISVVTNIFFFEFFFISDKCNKHKQKHVHQKILESV